MLKNSVAKFFLTIATAAIGVTAAPLDVRVEVPASVADLQPIPVRVVIRNNDAQAITISSPAFLRNVKLSIVPMANVVRGRCSTVRTLDGLSDFDLPKTVLAPGRELTIDANPLAIVPLGLPAGSYRITASYDSGSLHATSAAAELVVVEPSASPTYDAFLDVCRVIARNDAQAATSVVAFVDEHRDFPYGAALLGYAQHQLRGTARMAIADALAARFPSSEEGIAASRYQRDAAARDNAKAAAAEHDARFAAEIARLTPTERSTVQSALASIRDAGDFDRVESFVERHAGTFFAAEGIQAMIAAVQRGIVPSRMSAASRERYAEELTRRLRSEYGDSYWAKRLIVTEH